MHTTRRRSAALAATLSILTILLAARPARALVAAQDTLAASAAATPASVRDSVPVAPSTGGADSVRLIARLLAANGAPAHRAQPAARAILKYSRLRALDPLLVVGIIGVENAALAPSARSRAGARGVMQVMPSWKRDIKDCGGDLHEVFVNVCFGTRILRIALDASDSVREALLRYNGCVRAKGCHQYANAVFSRAGRAMVLSRMELASAAGAPGAGPPGAGPPGAAGLVGGGGTVQGFASGEVVAP